MNLKFSIAQTLELTDIIDQLITLLNKNGFFAYNKLLNDLKLSTQSADDETLLQIINNNTLFGGMGVLWEIYIEDPFERKSFTRLFYRLIEKLELIGVQSSRMNQVKGYITSIINPG